MPFRRIVFLVAFAALVTFLAVQFPHALSGDHKKADLIQMSILTVLISGSALVARRLPLSHTVKYAAAWLGVILLLVLGYSYKDALLNSRLAAELMPSRPIMGNDGSFSLRAQSDGHFYVDAKINGTPVRFMIDTGASDVVLSKEDAARIGLPPETLAYTRQYNTANGIVMGAPVRLKRLKVGNAQLNDFPASVNGGALDSSLLGMSALRRFGGVRIEGDVMTIGREQ